MADGMTSLSKFIQDLSVALMLLLMSLNSEPEDVRESYISKLKESPLPYFAASTPTCKCCTLMMCKLWWDILRFYLFILL